MISRAAQYMPIFQASEMNFSPLAENGEALREDLLRTAGDKISSKSICQAYRILKRLKWPGAPGHLSRLGLDLF